MPIESFWVRNYKAFPARTRIQVRPLTLLFGYNSVGKSALLRVLPLVAESINLAPSIDPNPLALSSDAARGANFDDLKSRLSDALDLSFGINWRRGPTTGASFRIRDIPEQQRQFVERMRVHLRDDSPVSLDWQLPPEDGLKFSGDYLISSSDGRSNTDGLRFRGLLPDTNDIDLGPTAQRAFEHADDTLRYYLTRVYWLKALRALPPRFEIASSAPPRIRSDGEGTTQLLAHDSLERGEILEEVSAWYEKATGHRLGVTFGAFNERRLFSIGLTPNQGDKRRVDLVDTGEGMAQVLPIVTLLSMAKHRQLKIAHTLLFEHPELHLHPAAHAELSSLFCEVASRRSCPRMIVETHSENFLLMIQLAIVEQELPPDRVIVYWVHQTPDGEAIVDEIFFDEFGQPVGDQWPPGLFSEDVEQSRKIVAARKRRRAR